jgi:hypothetical protein
MDISAMRDHMSRKMAMIPNFISPKSVLDHAVWNNMRYMSDLLLQLLSNKILPAIKVDTIAQQFDNEIELIMDISDKIDYINTYYSVLLNLMLEKCLEEELYESATNIRNYIDAYKNKFQF